MPKNKLVDFRAVREAITMEDVLGHYGLLEKMKRTGDNLSGCCPIHKGTNPTQFRVSVSKNLWNCFSECKHGGNALDFISRMEDVSAYGAAQKAIEWFKLDPDRVYAEGGPATDSARAPRDYSDRSPSAKTTSMPDSPAETKSEGSAPNPPLKFRLEKLQREHPYLTERGLTLETLVDFGVGFCAKGMMAGRIAIPIHNPDGQVVAYAGRHVGDPPEGTPKYKLPPGFRKSQELFNLDRARKEPGTLIVVEGFRKVVAEKKAKGYTEADLGTPYTHAEATPSGLRPQLLNAIEEVEAAKLLSDPGWCAQEKHDGQRRLVKQDGAELCGINKKGLTVGLPSILIPQLRSLECDFVLDAELVGEHLHVFDLLLQDETTWMLRPYDERLEALRALVRGKILSHVHLVETAHEAADKFRLLQRLKARNAEGLVFKRLTATYEPGKPNSGGSALKLKFTATASVIVAQVNAQCSVAVKLFGQSQPSGSVTIPPNYDLPPVGAVVEVRYLLQ